MKLSALLKSAFATILFSASLAHAGVVTFEADSTGAKPNGFVSGGVTFSDTMGANLQLYNNISECAIGNHCLAVFSDDSSALRMDFGGSHVSLSLDFGNDDPGFIAPGSLALLQLYMNGVQVGEASVVVNLDDLMNQSISYLGAAFNSAIFTYTDAAKNPANLIEVVDNITFDRVPSTDVPEPGTQLLFAAALAGLAATRRRTA